MPTQIWQTGPLLHCYGRQLTKTRVVVDNDVGYIVFTYLLAGG